MAQPIVFYDIPFASKAETWSPNTWKTRFCLNIKGIPYKTVWVEYPDIEALCKKIGVAATMKRPDGSELYTLPAIYDPNTGHAVADSIPIARYLDKTYPGTRILIPGPINALVVAFETAFWSAFGTESLDVPAVLFADVNARLRPRSQEYFRTTRERRLGKLEDLAPPGSEKRAKHWEGVKKGVASISKWIDADGNKKTFFMGDDVGITFPDIFVAAFFLWFKKALGEDSQEWADMMSWDGGRWVKLMTAFEKYEATDEGEDLVL